MKMTFMVLLVEKKRIKYECEYNSNLHLMDDIKSCIFVYNVKEDLTISYRLLRL